MRSVIAKFVALVVVAGVLGVSAGEPAAQEPNCGVIEPVVPDQYPTWSDDAGWSEASWYSTIQLADIDGDGRAEMLARTRDGMVASRFDPTTGMWISLGSQQGIFADRDGWNVAAKYYWTIEFADVDGRPGAEMIGRGPDGLYTYTWDSPSSQWRSVGEPLGALGDAEYGNPSAYGTITWADIDGRPGAELIARGYRGVKTWRWFAPQYSPKEQWFPIGDARGTFSDGKGWGVPEHSATIRFADVDGKPGAEMVGRGPESIETYTWDARTGPHTARRPVASDARPARHRRATTTDLSGRRTVAARRIALLGAPLDQTTGTCSSFAC